MIQEAAGKESELVLRPYSRKEEEERNARFAERIKYASINNPELVKLCLEMTDDGNLHGPDYVPFEPILEDSAHMPRLTHEQVVAFTRHSERLRTIEQTHYERAKPQPRQSALSQALQALERECAGVRYN